MKCQGRRTSRQIVGKCKLCQGKELRDKLSGSGMELVGNGEENDDPVSSGGRAAQAGL